MHYSTCLPELWAAASGENRLMEEIVTPAVVPIVIAATDDLLIDLAEFACLDLPEVAGCAFLPYST